MLSKIPGFKKTSHAIVVFAAIAAQLSCSKYNSNSAGGANSGLTFRAFVSNPVHPSAAGGGAPALNIIDATKDLLSPAVVSLATVSANVSDAGMMSLSPNHDRTLVISPRDSKMALVDNTRESILGAITLPGPSESFFVANDNSTVFVAIPSAAVSGQPQGVVEEISSAGVAVAKIPIPGAHYIVPSPNGNQILVFSDNADTVVLLTPGLIGATGQPTSITPCTTTQVPACILPATFDRPVGAIFDPSGSTAYVISCGAECGGTSAGIAALDMTNTGNAGSVLLANRPMIAATAALLQGTQLYVAGTQVGAGGFLSVLNLTGGISAVDCTSATPANCKTFPIADGYHTQMQMGANGQLFIGSRACSNVCLSIFDTTKSAVAAPKNSPAGDVTGIAPIPKRNVVYVCQGALLRVYDTTTDQLANIQPDGQPNVIGQAIDVKVIDF
jgi:hypothetical protein